MYLFQRVSVLQLVIKQQPINQKLLIFYSIIYRRNEEVEWDKYFLSWINIVRCLSAFEGLDGEHSDISPVLIDYINYLSLLERIC